MKFLKNLDYTDVQDETWESYFKMVRYAADSYMSKTDAHLQLNSFFAKRYHVKFGEQIVVQKEVSDDLDKTDLQEITFEELPLLNESLEFYFEDPKLGTFLLNLASPEQLLTAVGGQFKAPDLEYSRQGTICYANQKDEGVITFRIWGDICKQTLIEHINNESLSEVIDIAFLCFKVLIYASIPKLTPQRITKKQLKFGGKPKVKGRPNLPINRVVYLPRAEIMRGQGIAEDTGRVNNFYGRRGFMRTYRHDRYKKMKGKIQYIPPVVGTKPKPQTTYKVVHA
jgi:hypothetical protein